jgi:hypothetical protein
LKNVTIRDVFIMSDDNEGSKEGIGDNGSGRNSMNKAVGDVDIEGIYLDGRQGSICANPIVDVAGSLSTSKIHVSNSSLVVGGSLEGTYVVTKHDPIDDVWISYTVGGEMIGVRCYSHATNPHHTFGSSIQPDLGVTPQGSPTCARKPATIPGGFGTTRERTTA